MRPTVTVLCPALVHVALPHGLALHVWTRRGLAEITLAGAVVRMVAVGRA